MNNKVKICKVKKEKKKKKKKKKKKTWGSGISLKITGDAV